jgi:hypothetical protein
MLKYLLCGEQLLATFHQQAIVQSARRQHDANGPALDLLTLVMIGIVSGYRWKVQHRRFSGRVFSGARILAKLFKWGSSRMGLQNQVRIKKRTDRVALEILRCAHPFRRKVPVGKIIDLQFDEVLVRIGVIERCSQSVVEANLRFAVICHPLGSRNT